MLQITYNSGLLLMWTSSLIVDGNAQFDDLDPSISISGHFECPVQQTVLSILQR